MRIQISPTVNKLIVMHDGEDDLSFNYSVWSNMKKIGTNQVFGLTNAYLETLPKETQSKLFEVYKDIWQTLRPVFFTHQERINNLQVHFDKLYHLLDWDNCLKFCEDKVPEDKRYPVTKPTRYSTEGTYLRHEVKELTILAIFLRVTTPAIGSLTHLVDKEVGNNRKELVAARSYKNTGFYTNEAFQRFADYIASLSRQTDSASAPALVHGLPVSEMYEWRLGLGIVRRLLSHPKLVPEGNQALPAGLVNVISKFLESQLKDLKKKSYTDKKATGSKEDGDDSIVDSYRISNSIDLGTKTMLEQYLRDIPTVCKHLGLPDSVWPAVEDLYQSIMKNEHFVPSEFHYTLLGLVLFPVFNINTLPKMGREAYYSAIAISTHYYLHHGYEPLAKLLVAVKLPDNPEVIAFNDMSFKKLPEEIATKLNDQYTISPHGKGKKNPGHEAIEKIVNEVRVQEWVSLSGLEELRIHIANFIINRPWKQTAKSEEK